MNPNKNCVIINLYIDDFKIGDKDVRSRDKQKLIQRQQDSENVPVWVNDISEIFGWFLAIFFGGTIIITIFAYG